MDFLDNTTRLHVWLKFYGRPFDKHNNLDIWTLPARARILYLLTQLEIPYIEKGNKVIFETDYRSELLGNREIIRDELQEVEAERLECTKISISIKRLLKKWRTHSPTFNETMLILTLMPPKKRSKKRDF